ncbi:MAG TPA: hypothetical protein DIU00_09480 [Phycisphaerales bacterium]|nr:hypothetical protein [Phycisphaerales bacterium]
MNYELRTKKAFTLIELLVAVGILAIVLSFASIIFRVSIDAHRTAIANVEIMQKLRAITNQLNTDFKGLRKDGEIFVTWAASPVSASYEDNDLDGFERFDRIMFFADGDFYSYRVNPMVRGNVARVTYILARRNGIVAQRQARADRMLVRTQHILTADPALAAFLDPNNVSDQQLYQWNNYYEYEKMTLDEWKMTPWTQKADMLSVICDVKVDQSNINEQARGADVDPANPNSIHMLLCEGVGEFKIQGWNDAQQRWIPEVDPDGDGTLLDTDFIPDQDVMGLHSEEIPGVLYPYPPNGGVLINNIDYPRDQVDEAHFDVIPGLGRALKFTFTLFDSKGIIKEGRTFSHIVYLGN